MNLPVGIFKQTIGYLLANACATRHKTSQGAAANSIFCIQKMAQKIASYVCNTTQPNALQFMAVPTTAACLVPTLSALHRANILRF